MFVAMHRAYVAFKFVAQPLCCLPCSYKGQAEFRSNVSLPDPELWDKEQALAAQALFDSLVKRAPFLLEYR